MGVRLGATYPGYSREADPGFMVDPSTMLPLSFIGGYGGTPVTVTRPANATPYTAGDVVGATAAAIEFPLMGASGSEVLISSASLMIALTAVPSGMTSFRLHLYNVTPPGALADNAVWDLPSGDRASYQGYVDLGSPVDVGSTLYVQADVLNHQVRLVSTSLFGYLVTAAGYTPTSGEIYYPNLHAVAL